MKEKENLKRYGEKEPFYSGVRIGIIRMLLGGWLIHHPRHVSEAIDNYIMAAMDGTAVSIHASDLVSAIIDAMDMAPLDAIRTATRALGHGAKKYAPGNFRAAYDDMPAAREEYLSAIARHYLAHAFGESADPDSGLPHIAHALAGALILLEGEVYAQ